MEDEIHIVKSAEPAASCSDPTDAFELNREREAQSVAITYNHAEIALVRHGQTESNVEKRIQYGHLDVELTEVGRRQARAVADRLSNEGEISLIYSSDLKRATDTAKSIATACGGVEVIKDPDLRERNAGTLLQGLKRSEAPRKQPKAYAAYQSRERDQEIPI